MKGKSKTIKLILDEIDERGILESMGDGISIQDTNYRVVYQNQIHKNFVGEHIGEFCYKAYEQKEEICDGCPVGMVFKDGKTHVEERSAPTERGLAYFEITASPLKDITGEIIAGIEIARDITEKKRAEQLHEKHVKRLEKLYELSMMLSGDPIDIFQNAARMIGELLDVRVVCLSEIRGDELFFISVYVDGEVMTNVGSCPLSITPCATVQKTKDIRVYEHVAKMFPEASFLKMHNAFSYCGFPSMNSAGDVNAVTCLLDDKPHDFSEDDKKLLQIFGQRIGLEIERQGNMNMHKKAEEDLRKEREFTEKTINALMDTFFVFNPKAEKAILWNKRFQEVSGYTDEEIASLKAPGSYYSPEDLERAAAAIGEVLSKGQSKVEISLICKNGKRIPTEYLASVIKDEEGNPEYIISIGRDITERKAAEEELSKSENELSSIYDAITDFMTVISTDYRIARVNRIVEKQYGKDLVGKVCYEVYQGRKEICPNCPTRKAIETKKSAFSFQPATEVSPPVDIYAFPILNMEGDVIAVVEHGKDITERKKSEMKLEHTLHEKEILLKEIHHRVKNNLVVLYGLISLQEAELSGKESVNDVLNSAKQRIHAMGKVHKMLYESKSLSEINFSKYISSMVNDIGKVWDIPGKNIDISLDLEAVKLSIESAVPCGLIINELLMNAFKHSFQDRKSGHIVISFRRKEDINELQISDDGVGMPEENLSGEINTLGLKLITMLIKQLKGKITYKRENGSNFRIVF
jgi:PAS domain S-box-containing protein